MPNYERYKVERAEQAVGKSKIDRYEEKNFKDLLPSVKELLFNLPFMCTVFSLVGNLIVLAGVGVFFPKYIESQYGILASSASMYTGIMIVAGMVVGLVVVRINILFSVVKSIFHALQYLMISFIAEIDVFLFYNYGSKNMM